MLLQDHFVLSLPKHLRLRKLKVQPDEDPHDMA